MALLVRLTLVALADQFSEFAIDDDTYHHMAAAMASGDISGWGDFTYSLYWRTVSFLGPLTLLYKIFGPSLAVGQTYVALIGAATAVVVTRLCLEFMKTRWALTVGMTLALFPSQAFWSAQLMKDVAVWLVLATLGLLLAIANRSTGWRLGIFVVGVAVLLSMLSFLRVHTLVVAAWATMLAPLAGIPKHRFLRVGGAILVGVVVPWTVAAVGPAGTGLITNAGSLEEMRFHMAQGANTAIVDTSIPKPNEVHPETNSDALPAQQSPEVQSQPDVVDPWAVSTGIAGVRAEKLLLKAQQAELRKREAREANEHGSLNPNIVHLPRGLAVMLLEPTPLPFTGSASLRLARLEALIWYPILLLAAIGLWHARGSLRVLLFPLLAGGGLLVMYALIEGNIGTAHRHRGEFVWVVAMLAGLGARHVWKATTRNSPYSSGPT